MYIKLNYIYGIRQGFDVPLDQYQVDLSFTKYIIEHLRNRLEPYPEISKTLLGLSYEEYTIGAFKNIPVKILYSNSKGTFKVLAKEIVFDYTRAFQDVFKKQNTNGQLVNLVKMYSEQALKEFEKLQFSCQVKLYWSLFGNYKHQPDLSFLYFINVSLSGQVDQLSDFSHVEKIDTSRLYKQRQFIDNVIQKDQIDYF